MEAVVIVGTVQDQAVRSIGYLPKPGKQRFTSPHAKVLGSRELSGERVMEAYAGFRVAQSDRRHGAGPSVARRSYLLGRESAGSKGHQPRNAFFDFSTGTGAAGMFRASPWLFVIHFLSRCR
jgi:hypothetical protein